MTTPNERAGEPGRPQQWTYPTADPTPETQRRAHGPQDGHAGHGSHGLMMICCIPMIIIAVALVATGVVGSGAIVGALLCTVMMAAMTRARPGGHAGTATSRDDGRP